LIGLDLAQQEDWTAIIVADQQNQEIIRVERWQGIPYPAQLQRILGIAQTYTPCRIIIDSRNIGAVISEQLRNEGAWVEDWVSTGTISADWQKRGSKEKLIEKMIGLFESRSIKIPNNPDLIDELLSYSYVLSEAGNIKYGVPSGLHDDLCDALFMACWNLQIRGPQKSETAIEQKINEMKQRAKDRERIARSSDI
jgi:hypothetical protein